MIHRLYNLYSKAPDNPSITPTERFVTEALVGILESDRELKLNFLKEVCCIDFTTADITTEASYDYNGVKNYIDIRVQNDSKILFIEVKVDSGEGENQLQRYHELLKKLTNNKELTDVHLIYLTRDYKESPDYLSSDVFDHIYWSQVGNFFNSKNREKNSLVNSFLQFLDNLRLGPMEPITRDDLELLSKYVNTEEKISGIKAIMESEFREEYGKPSFSNQILNNERLILYKHPILEGDGWTELGLGLYFVEKPCIRAHIFITNTHQSYEKFKLQIKKRWEEEIEEYINVGISIGFKQNLSDLVGDRSPQDKLTLMIRDLFDEVNKVIRNTNDLNWKVTP